MAKPTWRDRLKAHGFKFFMARWGYFGVSKDGDYVSGRRADVVISALEREIIGIKSERDEARAEIERLKIEIQSTPSFTLPPNEIAWLQNPEAM